MVDYLTFINKEIMENIPTAEEFMRAKGFLMTAVHSGNSGTTLITDVMREFAKLHVEAALKAASGVQHLNIKNEYFKGFSPNAKEAILSSYPPENIK